MLKLYSWEVEEEQEKTKAKAKGVSREKNRETKSRIRKVRSGTPLYGALSAPFIEEVKLAGEALDPARGASGNPEDSTAGAGQVTGHRGCTSAGAADVP